MSRLREIRQSKKMSQFELAKKCDVDPSNISELKTALLNHIQAGENGLPRH